MPDQLHLLAYPDDSATQSRTQLHRPLLDSVLALLPPDPATLIAPALVAVAISGLLSLLGVWIAVAASRRSQKRGFGCVRRRVRHPQDPRNAPSYSTLELV